MLAPESIDASLVPLPEQLAGIAWPTEQWPRGLLKVADQTDFDRHAQFLFNLPADHGYTYALLVAKQGEIVFENYGFGANAFYLQYSWSMAKSIVQALAGILVRQGRLDLYTRLGDAHPDVNRASLVPEWLRQDDLRGDITLDQLLRMSSGLAFQEDYVDGSASDVIPMLSFDGRHDTGAFAASKPLAHNPGEVWSYSSGTTNIICRILRDLVGGPTDMNAFMENELFGPIGVRTATPRFDTSGTLIGSSFLLATAQDFARFGHLYLRNGEWEGRQILPTGWVDYARTCTYRDAEQAYGAHWWLNPNPSSVPARSAGRFFASGYDGQRLLLDPERDTIVLRLGRTDADHIQPIWDAVNAINDLL